MNIIKRHLLICTLFFCGFSAYGQNMQIFPKITGLNEFDLPEVLSEEWHDFMKSSRRQYYIDEYGNITIKNKNFISRHLLEYDGGTFIGIDKGEWGGELFYRNGTNEYKILDENIREIINYNNEIYILAGLSHLIISRGKIIKLELKNGIWESTSIIELNGSPEIYTVYNNKLYILYDEVIKGSFTCGLITFDGKDIQQILSKQFWNRLNPETIYVNEKIIAIGMRGCVAIINKENNEIKYYK
jgi:hypothetical protein